MAWDFANDKLVLFSGLNPTTLDDTFLYDVGANTWTDANPTDSPTNPVVPTDPGGPALPQMTWDGTRVVFHNFANEGLPTLDNINKTWGWDGSDWSELYTSGDVARAFGQSIGWTGDYVLAVGEWTVDSGLAVVTYPDTRKWDGSAWTQLFPATNIDPDFSQGSIATDGAGEAFYFGNNGAPAYGSDVYLWNSGTEDWELQSPAVSPPIRQGAGWCYGGPTLGYVLFGGRAFGGAYLDDTWLWDGSEWTEVFPISVPPARAYMPMASTPTKIILFGGANGGGLLNDTWTLTAEEPPTPPPTASIQASFGLGD